jgi:hypothetical protein
MRRPSRPMHLVILEHGGHDAFKGPLERDRLHVVRVQREANAAHRLEHLVPHRSDRGRVAIRAELATRAHRPLLGAARHTRVRVHHVAVGILAEPETERDGTVARAGHRTYLLGPRAIGLRDCPRIRSVRRSSSSGPSGPAPSGRGVIAVVLPTRSCSHRHDCKGDVEVAPDASGSQDSAAARTLDRGTNRSARRASRLHRTSVHWVFERDRLVDLTSTRTAASRHTTSSYASRPHRRDVS